MKTSILYILGILMVIGGVNFIISSTSSNESLWIKRSFADLNFFLGTNNAPYDSSTKTSPKYPVETIYEQAKVTLTPNSMPTEFVTVGTLNIKPPPRRHTH